MKFIKQKMCFDYKMNVVVTRLPFKHTRLNISMLKQSWYLNDINGINIININVKLEYIDWNQALFATENAVSS